MTSNVYDPSKNIVRVAGLTLTGVTSIKIARGNELFKNVEGISSLDNARVKLFKRPFKLSVKLLQTSASNSLLQHLYSSSEGQFNSFFRVEVYSQDNNGLIRPNISSNGYIVSAPDLTLDMESSDYEWVFMVNPFDFSGLTDIIF